METEATQTQSTENTEATVETTDGQSEAETSYLDGKYKSVSALEQGYKELQTSYSKKLGAFSGSPEEYTLDEGIEVTPAIEALMEFGKENQINNEALNKIIQLERETTEAETQAYLAEQKELLGKDADARIKNVVDWTRANLGEDTLDEIKGMITSAKSVEIFEAIAKLNKGTAPAPAQTAPSVDRDTIKQMRFAVDEYGNRKMSSDPAYRAKVEALEAELLSGR